MSVRLRIPAPYPAGCDLLLDHLDPYADRSDDARRPITLRFAAVMHHRFSEMVHLPGLDIRLFRGASGRLLQDRHHLIPGVAVVVVDDDDIPFSTAPIDRLVFQFGPGRSGSFRGGSRGKTVRFRFKYGHSAPPFSCVLWLSTHAYLSIDSYIR